jgi:hypothetical protein
MSNTKGVGGQPCFWQTLPANPCLPSRLSRVFDSYGHDTGGIRVLTGEVYITTELHTMCHPGMGEGLLDV